MDTKAFLDNLTSTSTKQVFSNHLTVTLSTAELQEVQTTFEAENIPHLIQEQGTIRFKHQEGEYHLVPQVEEVSAPLPEPEAAPEVPAKTSKKKK